MHSFENYTVINKLGSGSFSDVFKATQNSTGQSVAIKLLKQCDKTSERGASRIVRFEREMKLC